MGNDPREYRKRRLIRRVTESSEFDFLNFMAGPFYRVVNATAAYIAAFAAASIAQILSDSMLLGGLKYCLLIAFTFRAAHIAMPLDGSRREGCLASAAKCTAICALVLTATIAAKSAVEAGITQLDGDQSAKFAKLERARQKWRRVGLAYRCYDPYYANASKCTAIMRQLEADQSAIISTK